MEWFGKNLRLLKLVMTIVLIDNGAGVSAAEDGQVCKPGFELVAGMPDYFCYNVVAGSWSYNDATQSCKVQGGVLLSVDTKQELQTMFQYAKKRLDNQSKSIWMIYTRDPENKGEFWNQYTTVPMPEGLWRSGQPDPSSKGQNCVNVGYTVPDGASDVHCTDEYVAVCQRYAELPN